MHLLLTDILTCPRCGPEYGLILQADRLEDRRVETGRLGCANCREQYEISGGVVDLRFPHTKRSRRATPIRGAEPERAFRCAALLGVADPPVPVVLVEVEGDLAAEVAAHLGGSHVVGLSMASPPDGEPEGAVLSRVRVGERIPLRSGSVRGVALLGTADVGRLREAIRIVAADGRLVIDPRPEWAASWLRGEGLTVHLDQEGVVVASLPARR